MFHKRGEKRFASIPASFSCPSAQGSKKLFVDLVYSPLKSVGTSCYFGTLQAIHRVIFLQPILVLETIPTSCEGEHPPTAPSSCRAFHSAFQIGRVSPIKVSDFPQWYLQGGRFPNTVLSLVVDKTFVGRPHRGKR